MLVGTQGREMAVVDSSQPNPGEWVFELRTVRDEPAVLRARRADGPAGADLERPAPTGPVPIELAARVGRFGDPDHQRALVRAVARRLERLAGVDYAPR